MNIAAYCRVSTDKADQLNSLEAQKEFFSEYTKRTGDTLVRLYADEGFSGTKIKNRKEFLRMMADAEHGLFDMVVVKDISRFARNTVDLLQNVRKLKSLGIETQFLTANMTSMGNSEFVLTIFGALAQEESANTSKRVKFGKKMNAEKGRVPNIVYGYDKTIGDYFNLAINEEEAAVVRQIYEWYIKDGYGAAKISIFLNERGLRTKRNCQWSQNGVCRILTNELYTGKIINGKQEVTDFLTGQRADKDETEWMVVERPDLRIIEPEVFEQAQQQLAVRTRSNYRGMKKYRTDYTGFLMCGDCGRPMSSMSRPDLAPAYRCSTYTKHGKAYCSSHHIRVDRLDDTLKKVIEKLRDNSTLIAETLDKQLAARERKNISDDTPEQINRQISQLKAELAAVTTQRIRDIMANPTQEKLINETYDIIISSHSQKIEGLNAQLELLAKRDKAVADTNKAAATTVGVLNEILEKERLDKTDIGSIIDNIQVYEDHITVNLLTDIDGIIKAEAELAEPQKRLDTLVDDCVTVVSEGDPLEIYTSSDGEVIFKKYSAINEMAASASQVA